MATKTESRITPASSVDARHDRLRQIVAGAASLGAYALLVDAALETWWSSSPVRLWVAAPVALFVAFTAWLLRQQGKHRPSPSTGGWLAAFLLLAIIAFTVTVPGGLSDGIRIATLTTSTVLGIVTMAIIALAFVALAFRSPLPLPPRIVAATAALYGVIAFAEGLASGRTYVQLLQNGSFWQPLPWWLQGAFVGGLVVLPLALVVEVFTALAVLRVRGRLYRMAAFAIGSAITYLAFTSR